MLLQTLSDLRTQQSLAISYVDAFFVIAFGDIVLIVLVFFMKRSVAAKGSQPAAE